MPSDRDHRDAARIATEAGKLLLDLRATDLASDPKQLKDEGDRQSHEFIVGELAKAFPDDAVLSEEGKNDLARLQAERVWIVDPLDGTREFGELDRSDWAVHVALVMGGTPVAAAVALPAQGQTLATDPPPAPRPPTPSKLRLVVSRTRPPELTVKLADVLDAELVPMGSAGAKTMSIVQGTAEVYVHGGGQYEWDSAAPVGVAMAAGLHCSRLDGSPLVYNNEDPYLPDLMVCPAELAERVLAEVAKLL
jgi:3'(2'), 5'-bisphosphate nucleotidase